MRWFTDAEVKGLDPELVQRLDNTRDAAGVPFEITSGYREGDDKSHGRRLAADLGCSTSYRRMRIVKSAVTLGAHCTNCGSANIAWDGTAFRRIGIYDRHVHLDIDKKLPQDVLWWGVSK